MPSIGFHGGPGGNHNGLGNYYDQLDAAGIPFFIKSTDHYGHCFEAANIARASGVPHVIVYRLTTGGQGYIYDFDVPPYEFPPVEAAAIHWTRTKAELPPEFDKELVWVEPINEIDRNRADWLGHFAAEIGILAMADGYKVTLFGWSSGEPEPEHWQTPGMKRYLTMCAQHPDRLAVSLHEYSYNLGNIKDGFPYKIGRFQALFAACDAMGLARPTVHITEWGWTHEETPEPAQAMIDIDWAYRLYAPYEQVKGLGIWGLLAGFGGIANLAQRLIAPVTDYMLDTPAVDPVDPPPVPPPPPPVPPSDDNLLRNPSFEDGWWHPNGIPELQIPNEWDFGYYDETTPNPHDPAAWSKFQRPEVRTLPASQLPPAERPLFIRDGEYTLKPFGDNKSIYFWLEQTLDLPAGTKRFTPWTFADLVKGYVGNTKVWADDPQGRDGLARVLVNGQQVGEWVSLVPGEWNAPVWEFTAAGSVTLRIEFMCPFPLDNAGLFCDGWTLQAVGVEPPPVEPPPPPIEPPPPPPTPAPAYLHARLTAVANIRRDATTSKPAVVLAKEGLELIKVGNVTGQSVGGNNQWVKAVAFISRSYVTDSGPGKVKTNRNVNLRVVPSVTANWPIVLLSTGIEFEYLGNVDDLYNAGQWAAVSLYIWKPLTIDAQPGIRFGKLLPGTLSITSPFNAPRSYAGEHEGLDFAAPIGTAVYAGANGIVDGVRTVDPGTGYGKYVRIKYDGRYKAWFGHLSRVDVTVGQPVTAGQQIALSGNSGGSTGPHLHLTLQDIPAGLEGYIVSDVIDPTLYLFPAVNLQPGPPPPPPPPPPGDAVDLVPYFVTAAPMGTLYEVKTENAGQQRHQTQVAGNVFYHTKDNEWEQLLYDNDFIYRGVDTSPGLDRYYQLKDTDLSLWSRWARRRMAVGEMFERRPTITFYRKHDCSVISVQTAVNYLRLNTIYPSFTFFTGVTLNNVVELDWLNTPGGSFVERYYYAKGYGLVGWNSSDGRWAAISEIHEPGARPDNVREVGCFSI